MKFKCTVKNGELDFGNPYDRSRIKDMMEANEGKEFELVRVVKKRTNSQNASIHLYLTQLADALDQEGHTVQDVVEKIKKAEIRPTMEVLKEILWKPILKIMFGKKSTAQSNTKEVDKVYEAVNAFIGREFELHVPFPCGEELINK